MKYAQIAGTLLPVFLFASSVAAQTAPSPAPTTNSDKEKQDSVVQMSPFTVTTTGDNGYFSKNTLVGTRSNERLINIPQNIQVINSQFLDDVRIDNGIDGAKYATSGIEKREATSGDLFLRGFRLSVLRDGLGWRGNLNIPLYDIERIEVIKGPAALLFGSSASTGGTVNYVSKAPSNKLEYSGTATVGTFNLIRGVASAAGPVTDSDAYRVTVAATNSDAPRNFDYFHDKYISFSFDHKLSPTAILNFNYYYIILDQIVSTTTVDSRGQLLNVPRNRSFQEPWVDAPRYVQYATISLKNEITPTLHAQYLVNFSEQNFNFNQIFANGVPNLVTGLMKRNFQNYRGRERRVNMQMDFLKTFDTGSISHKVTFGAGAYGMRLFQYSDNVPIALLDVYNPVYNTPKPAFIPSSPGSGGSATATANIQREESAYVQEQMDLFKGRLLLVGGVSYNGFNNNTTDRITNVITPRDDLAFVKRYGFVYKPITPLCLYYNYSESFAFNKQFFVGGPREGQRLDPSFSRSKEVGVKVETPNGLLFGSVDYFDLDITNVRITYALPDGRTGIGESAGNHSRGWEFDVGLSLNSPAGPMQAILTCYTGHTHDLAGVKPNGVGDSTWSAFLTQRVVTGPLKGLKIGAGAFYKDDFLMSSATGQTKVLDAPSYITTTAFISYSLSRYTFSLNVDNVFDKYYIEGGDTANTLNMAIGRTTRFSASYKF